MAILAVSDVTPELTGELASWGDSPGPVLSLLLDLDPARFATPEARSSEISSLIDGARPRVEDPGRDHAGRMALRELLEECRSFLKRGEYTAGARGVAVFGHPTGREVRPVRLHAPTSTRSELDSWPLLSPLAHEPANDWAVALVDNRRARLLRGGPAGLHQDIEMVERSDPLADSEGSGTLPDDVREHFDRAGEALRVAHREQPIGALLLGCHREAVGEIEARLPPELTPVLVGDFAVDTKASPDEVLAKARPLMDAHAEKQIDEALERLGTAAARGTGARGLAPVLEALTERRVGTMLLEDDLAVSGVECPACGWLGPAGAATCPADDTPTEATDDVIEPALARAFGQDAGIHFLHERDDLRDDDGIAAVLRF